MAILRPVIEGHQSNLTAADDGNKKADQPIPDVHCDLLIEDYGGRRCCVKEDVLRFRFRMDTA